ncbi:hypothetical protein Btru_076186 [Bulinus truncatus]|nr:hypothetical protein Btru_076186 [Bulinus truncatus]
MSKKREAKVKLKSKIRSHDAVVEKLCPGDVGVPVTLRFKYNAYVVLSSDDLQQSFTTVSYLEVVWNDPDISWDPLDYDGIESLYFLYDELWDPNILVTNSADYERVLVKPVIDQLYLNHTGEIYMKTPLFIETTCSLDLTIYPFDQQNCEISFLPFFDDCPIAIQTVKFENSTNPFQLKGEWEIIDQTIASANFSADVHGLPSARVTLKIARASLFYIITVIAPMVLTSLLTSFVFLIPPESGEKVSFLVSVFVSNAVFLSFIASTISRSMTVLNIPKLTIFLVSVLLESFAALLASLFVIRTYNVEQRNKAKRHEKLMLHQLNELMNTTKEPDLLQSSHKDHKKGAHETEDKFHAPNSRAASEANSFQTAFYLLLAKTQLSGKTLKKLFKKQIAIKRSCCIKARHWDIMFFFLFTLGSIPYYLILIFIPSSSDKPLPDIFN